MTKEENEKMENEKIIYEGHISLVQRDHNGHTYDIMKSKDAVAMLYVDDTDKVWLASEYRQGPQATVLGAPAETIDKSGKNPLEHMIEGMEEECGIVLKPEQAEHAFTWYSSPGIMTEKVWLYTAHGPHTKTQQNLGEHEQIDVVTVPFDTAYAMIGNEIQSSKTIALLQYEKIQRLQRG